MSSAAAAAPIGNVYDKYTTANPVARRLVGRFRTDLDDLLRLAAPTSVLDVGCGEGVVTQSWAQRLADRPVVGLDLEDAGLASEWRTRTGDNLSWQATSGDGGLPFQTEAFDLVAAIESLEHVEDPTALLGEMRRCARRFLLVSVPREPLWRGLNVARGAYWRRLGNTPGHRHHWSGRSFAALLEGHGSIVAARRPLPWTVLLVRV